MPLLYFLGFVGGQEGIVGAKKEEEKQKEKEEEIKEEIKKKKKRELGGGRIRIKGR